jgi:CRP/FNR family cyclic AMP-dependent transcriptional regulator
VTVSPGFLVATAALMPAKFTLIDFVPLSSPMSAKYSAIARSESGARQRIIERVALAAASLRVVFWFAVTPCVTPSGNCKNGPAHKYLKLLASALPQLAIGHNIIINPDWELVMPKDTKPSFEVMGLLTQHNTRWTVSKYKENQIVYAQGDPADSVFYVHRGKVKVTVISKLGKEAIVAIRGPDEFCGEGAMTGTPLRLDTTTTMSTCEIIRLENETVVRLLHQDSEFADYFLAHLLTRAARVEADLLNQLVNPSEMRLARALLLLANYGNDLSPEPLPVKVNQETLAALIGTTRSRVNFFMNKFRKLGLIKYNGKLEVQKALLNFVLNERPHIES